MSVSHKMFAHMQYLPYHICLTLYCTALPFTELPCITLNYTALQGCFTPRSSILYMGLEKPSACLFTAADSLLSAAPILPSPRLTSNTRYSLVATLGLAHTAVYSLLVTHCYIRLGLAHPPVYSLLVTH